MSQPMPSSRDANANQAKHQTQSLSVDEIMRKVRHEVIRKKSLSADAASDLAKDFQLPRWQSVVPRLPVQRDYRLAQLLSFSDQDFIDQTYRILLRRAPDEGGGQFFLNALRSNQLSKLEVLGQIRFSPEGMRHSVHVDGLLIPYTLRRWCRKKWIGRPLSWCLSFLRLDGFRIMQEQSNQLQATEIQHLGQLYNRTAIETEQRLVLLESMLGQRPTHEQLSESVLSVKSILTNLQDEMGAVNPKVSELQLSVDAMSSALTGLDELAVRLDTIQAEVGRHAQHLDLIDSPLSAHEYDELYSAFEEQFRGTRELVRERCAPYLEWLRAANAGTAEAPALDIGCGRGEWLELLRENGMIARGFDLNKIFIEQCTALGLHVEYEDGLLALIKQQDNSIGAVTSMHLVEHLANEKLIALIDQTRRVLRPGGLLLLETPNPENIEVGAHWFYMDPTHRNPIPPQALQWLVQARGFTNVRIERLDHARQITWPVPVDESIAGAASINAMVGKFIAPPDYAVVAYKA